MHALIIFHSIIRTEDTEKVITCSVVKYYINVSGKSVLFKGVSCDLPISEFLQCEVSGSQRPEEWTMIIKYIIDIADLDEIWASVWNYS